MEDFGDVEETDDVAVFVADGLRERDVSGEPRRANRDARGDGNRE